MAGRPEKFAALKSHLKKEAAAGKTSVRMSFKGIAALGTALPASAYKHRAWWTNHYYRPGNVNNNSPKAWERAGFRTCDVDLAAGKVCFELKGSPRLEDSSRRMPSSSKLLSGQGLSEAPRAYATDGKKKGKSSGACRHPLYGALKGHLRLVAGTDLTKPADPKWGDSLWGKDDKR